MFQTPLVIAAFGTFLSLNQPSFSTTSPEPTYAVAQNADSRVLGATTIASPIPSPKPSPTVTPSPVPSPKPKPTPLPPNALDELFVKYGTEHGVDPEVLKHIAKCESTYNPAATNGPYGGMYQFSASTWSSTRNAMGLDPNPDLRFNGEEAIRTAAWKIGHGGIGAWPTCGKRAMNATATPQS